MSEDLYAKLGKVFSEKHGTIMGQMFGKPCLKIAAKAFAVSYNGNMVFKIGQEEVNLLKDKYIGSDNWDPSGKKRPMKDWLLLPVAYAEDWTQLAKQALDYVKEINKI